MTTRISVFKRRMFFPLDYLHSIPVAQMGNYQEYLKMMPSPLREIDPDQPKRLHTFGNPFKQDKKVSRFLRRGARQRVEVAPLTPPAFAAL